MFICRFTQHSTYTYKYYYTLKIHNTQATLTFIYVSVFRSHLIKIRLLKITEKNIRDLNIVQANKLRTTVGTRRDPIDPVGSTRKDGRELSSSRGLNARGKKPRIKLLQKCVTKVSTAKTKTNDSPEDTYSSQQRDVQALFKC